MTDIRWKAVAAGSLVAGALVLLALAALGGDGQFGGRLVVEFVALVVGGVVAARLGGRAGVLHGVAVSIVYILVATAVQGWQELNLASTLGPEAVESVDLLSLIVSDLAHLCAGALGGLLAGGGRVPARP